MVDTLIRRKVYARVIIDRNGKTALSAIAKNGNKMLALRLCEVFENRPLFIPGETKSGKSDFEVVFYF